MPNGQMAPILRYLGDVAAADGLADGRLLEQFVGRGDEVAFTALVRRHGPMVLGVCRRVLRDVHAAEDAFQATFLLLVRKAGSLRRPEALGPWLYGVAYRTALKARRVLNRRREQPLHELPATATDDLVWRDLRPVLDGAINRLPAKYRAPFVLCYLDGMTNAQAARHLGCPAGTVATRLARARQQLRGRLAKHALVLPAGLLAAAVVPRALLAETVRAATALAADSGTTAGVLPIKIVALMEGAWRSMMLDRLRSLVVALVLVGAAAGGVGLLAYRGLAEEPAPARVDPQVPPPAPPPPQVEEHAADSTFRTANFLVKAPTRRIARLIGEAAEHHRKALAQRWLGKELPPWPKPCPIDVKITLGETGGATSFGYDSVTGEGGKVRRILTDRHMHQEGPLDRILSSSLPHEVMHTVLADYFTAPVPRWADEGVAIQAEDEEEQQRHDKLVRQLVSTGRAFRLRHLVRLRDFPQDVMVLYAQGYSLTRFLVERKDRKTFLAFVRLGMNEDWDTALREQYGYADFDELEKDWLNRLKKDAPILPPAPALGSGGPPPRTVLAFVARGDVILRWPVLHYEPRTTYRQPAGSNGPVVATTSYELKAVEQSRSVPVKQIQAFDSDNKRVSTEDLTRLLRKETPVLLASDGQPVDPFQLQLIKPGTLILVAPGERVAPASATAPAVSVPPPPSTPVGMPAVPPGPVMNERNFDLPERIPVPNHPPAVPAPTTPPRQ
jgi:RNA polymerase sigma factor (sigma-70 family)